MSTINLNNSGDYVKEIKIFNEGKAGLVENVRVRIEKKAASDDEKKPVYKLIATDENGAEVNEGFYYQEEGSKSFTNFQAQRLILLAKGVIGEDVKFPVFKNPTEVLDGVMHMVAKELDKKLFRVLVTYGTTKRKSAFLNFKSFGYFIQKMSEENKLKFDKSDWMERAETPEPTPSEKLIPGVIKSGNPENLDWLNE